MGGISGWVKKEVKVHISTSNYHVCPIFNPELQNQTFCTLKLLKPDEISPNPNYPGFDPTWQMVLTNHQWGPHVKPLSSHLCSLVGTGGLAIFVGPGNLAIFVGPGLLPWPSPSFPISLAGALPPS